MRANHSTHGLNGSAMVTSKLAVAVAVVGGLLALVVAASYPGPAVGFGVGVGLAVGLQQFVSRGVFEHTRVSGLSLRLGADA